MKNLRLVLIAVFSVLLLSSVSNAQDPEGRLFGLSSTDPVRIYSINPATGQAVEFLTGNGRSSIVGLAFVQGTPYGSDLQGFPGAGSNFNVGSFAPDGDITFVSDQNDSSNWHGLASDECGQGVLYSVDNDLNPEYPLIKQRLNGSTTTVGSTDVNFVGLAYDDENGILYGIDSPSADLYTISTEDASTQFIGSTGLTGSSNRLGLAYDEINKVLYAIANVDSKPSLYTLNVNTGQSTLIGETGQDVNIDGLAWKDDCELEARVVPTLSEWGLMAMAGLIGLAGLMAISRRRVSA